MENYVKINLPILISQLDSRWANVKLGYNTQPNYNLYNYGCLLCDQVAVLAYFGVNLTPVELNETLKTQNGFQNFGDYVYGSIPAIWKQIKERQYGTPSRLTDAQMNEIRQSIDNGYPVVCRLDANPKTPEAEYHYVTIVGYNPGDENDMLIMDPLGGQLVSIKKYLGFLIKDVRTTIQQLVFYEGPKPAPGEKQICIPISVNEGNVKKASQWDKFITFYELGDPIDTLFEKAQAFISGLKSRAKDQENRAIAAEKQSALNAAEVENQKDKNSRLEDQLIRTEKTYEAELLALKQSKPDVDQIVGELTGKYKEELYTLNNNYIEAKKKTGEQAIQITSLKKDLETCQKNQLATDVSVKVLIAALIKKLLKK